MRLTRYHLAEKIDDSQLQKRWTLVLNTLNAAQISLDEEAFNHIENGNFHLLPSELVTLLKEKEFLTELSPDEEILKVLAENILVNKESDCLTVVVQPSAWCQMGCLYCGQSHNKEKKINILSVFQFIEKKVEEHQPQKLLISWFGSEPLTELSTLRALSLKLIEMCQIKGIRFYSKIVTNGLNLNKKNFNILVQDCQCKSFEVTLDGTADFHDKRRFTKHRGKTFEVIYKNLLEIAGPQENFLDPAVQISIRCN